MVNKSISRTDNPTPVRQNRVDVRPKGTKAVQNNIDTSYQDFQFGSQPKFSGLNATLERGLGPIKMPDPIRLVGALEAATQSIDAANNAVPGLTDLAKSVLDDEITKLNRYMDLNGQ